MDRHFDTPEEAALAGWSASAKPVLICSAMESSDRAIVCVDTEPSHPMKVQCVRSAEGWLVAGDSNGCCANSPAGHQCAAFIAAGAELR
jgi:hypothetical protein